jgi:hypothetical protein
MKDIVRRGHTFYYSVTESPRRNCEGVIRTSFEDVAIALEDWENKFAEYPTRPHLNLVTGTLFGR